MCHDLPTHPRLQLFLRFHRAATACARIAGHHALGLALIFAAHNAAADLFDSVAVSGSASLQSQYRYRGQPLSDGKAVPQASVNLDSAGGWYAGAFVSGATIAERDGAQTMAFAGRAQRLDGGGSREAGCTRVVYSRWHASDYTECYLGASGTNSSARLYYAPHYLGRDARTLYAEINYFYAAHPRLNLVAHAGLLHTLSGTPWPGIPPASRKDGSLGFNLPLDNWSLQLLRVFSQDDGARYPHDEARPRQAWVVSTSYAF